MTTDIPKKEWIRRLDEQRARAGRAEAVVEAILFAINGKDPDRAILQDALNAWGEGTELCSNCIHVQEAHLHGQSDCDREGCNCREFKP